MSSLHFGNSVGDALNPFRNRTINLIPSGQNISLVNSKQTVVLFVLVLGTLMGALDSTIVILAFPAIAEGLHSDIATTIWIILIYLLVTAVTTTPFGRIGDLYGRSRMFNAGFAIFTIGSVLCGIASNIQLLILFRAVQAIGGSLLQSNSCAIIADVFPRNERGSAFGYNSLGWTAGAMIGIVLGGMITTFLGWKYIFFINIPIGIAAVILGIIYLKDVEQVKTSLDLVGMSLLAGSLSLLSLGAVDYAGQGLNRFNLVLMILGVITVPLFIFYELRSTSPMLDLRAFSDRILKYSILAAFFMSLGFLSVVFLIIMYLQGVKRAISTGRLSLADTRLCGGQYSQSFDGKVIRPLRCQNNSQHGNSDAWVCHSGLSDAGPEHNNLCRAYSFSYFRYWNLDVLSGKQQRRNGQCTHRIVWEHIWPAPNPPKHRHLGVFCYGHLGSIGVNSQVRCLRDIHWDN